MSFIVGIDASRNRSGGAKAHLLGLLTSADPMDYGISHVHLWAYRSLIDTVPDRPWLTKHSPPSLAKSLLSQVWWQYRHLPKEARKLHCNVLFNTDAGSVCPFRPCVTMSQDMLSFEPGESKRFGFSLSRGRLYLLRIIQTRSLRHADRAMFLTNYAARVIQNTTGPLDSYAVVPHGVGEEFRQIRSPANPTGDSNGPIRLLYVSNASMYKHQWNVIRAVGKIRAQGRDISLLLVGGGKGPAQKRLEREMRTTDPRGEFILQTPFAAHTEIPRYLGESDVFVFASSCENMPITLLEAMAAGLPIACSNRGPMPEVLSNGGVYFDPEDADSIKAAIDCIIRDAEVKGQISNRARELAEQYSWKRCANETWRVLGEFSVATHNKSGCMTNDLATCQHNG